MNNTLVTSIFDEEEGDEKQPLQEQEQVEGKRSKKAKGRKSRRDVVLQTTTKTCNPDDQTKETVLVTGCDTFIGTHIIRQLLKESYKIRGTVTHLRVNNVNAFRDQLIHHAENACEMHLYAADPHDANSWLEPCCGVDYIIHCINQTPFPDVQDETHHPVQECTKHVLNASVQPGNAVKRLVFTSSISAVAGDLFEDGEIYSETDWPQKFEELEAYAQDKVLAEQEAWSFVKSRRLEQLPCFDLSVMCPGFVLGPLLTNDTNRPLDMFIRLLSNKMQMLPDIYLPVADVRDVALAHVRALKQPECADQRFILVSSYECSRLQAWGSLLNEVFDGKLRLPTSTMPDFVIKFLSYFNKSLKSEVPRLGKKAYFENGKMIKVLEINPIPITQTLIDTAQSLIDRDLVPVDREA